MFVLKHKPWDWPDWGLTDEERSQKILDEALANLQRDMAETFKRPAEEASR